MKNTTILLVGIFVTLVPAVGFTDSGLVAAGSFGSAQLSDDFDGFDVDTNSTAYRLTLGWRFNDHFELEAGYHNFGDFEQRFDVEGTPVDVSLKADGFTLGATGVLPVGERWTLFARGGVFFWDGDASINNVSAATPEDSNIYLGFGAGFAVTEKLSLTADASRYELEGTSSSVFSAGLRYTF